MAAEDKDKKLDYRMDISEDSYGIVNTPASWALKLPFYIEGAGHFYASDSYYTKRHGYKSYLALLTVRGSGFFCYRGIKAELNKNTAVVIDCNEHQYYRTMGAEGWDFFWIHFGGVSAGYYTGLINDPVMEVINTGEESNILDLIKRITDSLKKDDINRDLELSKYMTEILTLFLMKKKNNKYNSEISAHGKAIDECILTIRENYNKKLSVEELAARCHISKYHFLRVFREYSGQTPYDYIISLRISQSKNLLLGTDLTVSEISLRCGFRDSSNFIRAFKRYTGTTPGIFRKGRLFGE